jgi:hypothetical protein
MSPHRDGDPLDYKDAIFLSPHKFIGGPGTPGVLCIRRELLSNRVPAVVGGGTVAYVNSNVHVYMADKEHREEGGTPAIVESIRCGLVFQLKEQVGVEAIREREESFIHRAIERWERHPNIEILQLGGMLRKSSSSVMGSYAENILSDFFCSKFFLGVDGIDLEFGLTTTHAMEAHLNQRMIKVCQKTIVLADSTKFGKRGFGRICGLDEIDQIITDSGISDNTRKTLESLGVEVTII